MKLTQLAVLLTLSVSFLSACEAGRFDEALLRQNIAKRMPHIPKIDEVRPAPVAGLYEVRIGSDIFYSDAKGDFLLQGELFDTRTQTNVTQARIDKLSAIDFAALPLKDAIPIVQGSGARKLAVFVDPNCGYCKQFERDLAALKDVTIYTFLLPILGHDSALKARNVWCAKEPGKTWREWMLGDKIPADVGGAPCDATVLTRNVDFGHKHAIRGTPATVFPDNVRLPGAVPLDKLEKLLATASAKGG